VKERGWFTNDPLEVPSGDEADEAWELASIDEQEKLTKEQEAELAAERLKEKISKTLVSNNQANHIQKDIKVAVEDVVGDKKRAELELWNDNSAEDTDEEPDETP